MNTPDAIVAYLKEKGVTKVVDQHHVQRWSRSKTFILDAVVQGTILTMVIGRKEGFPGDDREGAPMQWRPYALAGGPRVIDFTQPNSFELADKMIRMWSDYAKQ